MEAENIDFEWKSTIYNLPRNVLKFLLNSVLDTLPTNTNLALWNKRLSDKCNLCGSKETLGHVLNACPLMLAQQRYTWRHNNVLKQIRSTVKDVLDIPSATIYCDLPGSSHFTIPPDILVTTQRPDLVIVDREQQNMYILELTVCFESNRTNAHKFKDGKYEHLLSELVSCGYTPHYCAVEVGSRGTICYESKQDIKLFLQNITTSGKIANRTLKTAYQNIAKTALTSSYIIFYSKYDKDWTDFNIAHDV